MPGCAVTGCINRNKYTKGIGIKYFRFPKDEYYCKKWINACGRGDNIKIKNAYICSSHFEPDCVAEPSLKEKMLNYTCKTKRFLKPDAVPTLNLVRIEDEYHPEDSSPNAKRRKVDKDVIEPIVETKIDFKDNLVMIKEEWTEANDDLPEDLPYDRLDEKPLPLGVPKNQHQIEIEGLKEKVEYLEREHLKLQQRLEQSERKIEKMEAMLGKILTPDQINQLLDT